MPGRTREQDEDGALVDINYSYLRKLCVFVCVCVCVCVCNCEGEEGTEFWVHELNEESSVMLLGILLV